MRRLAISLACFITIILFVIGCSPNVGIKKESPEDIALEEAKKITSEKGYSILNSEGIDVLIGDFDVLKFIKDVSIEEGYVADDFDSMSGDRKIIEYELKERSNNDGVISLGIVVDKGKAIGGYLNYYGYKPSIRPISFKEVPTDEYIVHIGGKYLDNIEFGIGDSAEELVDEWGLPIEVDYINGGLYLKYKDAIFYTDGYINDDKTYHYGSINAIDAEKGFGINSGMTIEQSREYLGWPDARDIFDELKEFGEGILPSTDYYYRDGYTISIPYDKDTKQVKYIRLDAYRLIPDIIGSGFLELSNTEIDNYNNFIVDFNQKQIQTNSPISIMKLWIHARMEENYEAEWELYSKEEKVLGWDKEEHMKNTKDIVPGDFAEFKNPINIEVKYSDDYSIATVSWEDKYLDKYDAFGNPFRYTFDLYRSEDSRYRVAFRPMQ